MYITEHACKGSIAARTLSPKEKALRRMEEVNMEINIPQLRECPHLLRLEWDGRKIPCTMKFCNARYGMQDADPIFGAVRSSMEALNGLEAIHLHP
jgi:hypothetical protein